MLTYNALDNSVYQFKLSLNEEAQDLIPKNEEAFLKMDYEWLCSSKTNRNFEIDAEQFNSLLNDNNATIIDVREKDEQPFVDAFEYIQIPLNELLGNQWLIENDNVVVFCKTGKRSLQAAQMLKEIFNKKKCIV